MNFVITAASLVMTFRYFLFITLISLAGLNAQAQDQTFPIARVSVHDPVIIRQKGTTYVFCTGRGIAVWSSTNMEEWKHEKPVFATPPAWTTAAVPTFDGHFWAPDISFYDGKYYLYYAISAFGKNTSCIGLAINATLDPADPHFKWEDKGKVVQSIPGQDNWNAIDPNLITDDAGVPYLAFGSFWGGLQLARLTPDRLQLAEGRDKFLMIASRKPDPAAPNPPALAGNPPDAGGNAIEAPFLFKHGDYFYLFASIDYCCRGPRSNYKMIVGRAKKVTGPYVDKEEKPLARGGGTILLEGDAQWYGVGHNAVCTFDGVDYIVFHGYDAADHAISKLRIEKLSWDADGWPVVQMAPR
jgi:arabinan endo-1,5-alpha-L-arabinosidase